MINLMRRVGDDGWFGFGDKDLATNLLRAPALNAGKKVSEVTASLSGALGVKTRILPMSNDRVPTMVETVEQGTLPFQEYFVRYRWQPTVRRLWYEGADQATPAPGVLKAISEASAIVICPSNPMLSVE